MATNQPIQIGRIAILFKGEWNSTVTYVKLDFVTLGGISYLCINNNKNKNPSDINNQGVDKYWAVVADATPSDQSIATNVEDWLDAHISDTLVVDDTLSISGAAADAAATGNITAAYFDETKIYNVGDYVNYQGSLYKCHTTLLSAGPWTNTTNWKIIKVGEELTNLNKIDTDWKELDLQSFANPVNIVLQGISHKWTVPIDWANPPFQAYIINLKDLNINQIKVKANSDNYSRIAFFKDTYFEYSEYPHFSDGYNSSIRLESNEIRYYPIEEDMNFMYILIYNTSDSVVINRLPTVYVNYKDNSINMPSMISDGIPIYTVTPTAKYTNCYKTYDNIFTIKQYRSEFYTIYSRKYINYFRSINKKTKYRLHIIDSNNMIQDVILYCYNDSATTSSNSVYYLKNNTIVDFNYYSEEEFLLAFTLKDINIENFQCQIFLEPINVLDDIYNNNIIPLFSKHSAYNFIPIDIKYNYNFYGSGTTQFCNLYANYNIQNFINSNLTLDVEFSSSNNYFELQIYLYYFEENTRVSKKYNFNNNNKIAIPNNCIGMLIRLYHDTENINVLESDPIQIHLKLSILNLESNQSTLKMLFIGNSYTGNSLSYVPWMIRDLDPNIQLTLAYTYTSGAGLDYYNTLYDNDGSVTTYRKIKPFENTYTVISDTGTDGKNFKETLIDENWDIIVLQQNSSSGFNWDSYSNINILINKILNTYSNKYKSKNIKFGFLLSHVRRSNPTSAWIDDDIYTNKYNHQVKAALRLLDFTPIDFIIPCATAIQNGRLIPELKDLGNQGYLCRDTNWHLQDGIPKYIAGLTVALSILKLLGKEIIGVKNYKLPIRDYNQTPDSFSSTKTYDTGAIVKNGNQCYRCHTAITEPGSWTGESNWWTDFVYFIKKHSLIDSTYIEVAPPVDGTLEQWNYAQNCAIAAIKNPYKYSVCNDCFIDDYDESRTYIINDFCYYENEIYKCISNIVTPEEWNLLHWTQIQTVKEV